MGKLRIGRVISGVGRDYVVCALSGSCQAAASHKLAFAHLNSSCRVAGEVQIIGRNLNDDTTIAFAGMIERAFGGLVLPPSFAE